MDLNQDSPVKEACQNRQYVPSSLVHLDVEKEIAALFNTLKIRQNIRVVELLPQVDFMIINNNNIHKIKLKAYINRKIKVVKDFNNPKCHISQDQKQKPDLVNSEQVARKKILVIIYILMKILQAS